MSSNVVNQVAYLRTSREFPPDLQQLCVEVTKSYIDTSNAVNSRIIGIFPRNRPAITGESWFFNNQRQQTLRQDYAVTPSDIVTGFINHNINGNFGITPSNFTRCWGSFTDGTNGYGFIWATNGPIPNQSTFYLTSTQIVFVIDAGSPVLTSGRITLEWLSAV